MIPKDWRWRLQRAYWKFRLKLRKDWKKNKVNVLFQCVSGIACGLLSALYLATENKLVLICLIVIAGITLLIFKEDRVKNG